MRRIAIINQKGGVGKTTTTVNLGAALARAGRKVLLLDLDPQANLTLHVDRQAQNESETMTYLLIENEPLAGKLRATDVEGLWVVPADSSLGGVERVLADRIGREMILRESIETYAGEAEAVAFDYVLMDCPPSLGVLSANALVAAGEVLIPMKGEYFSLQGMAKLTEVIQLVRDRLNPNLEIAKVLPCMFDARTRLSSEVLEEIHHHFGDMVSQYPIRVNVKLAEAPSFGRTIFDHDPHCNGAEDYAGLAQEILGMEAGATPHLRYGPALEDDDESEGELQDAELAEDAVEGEFSIAAEQVDPMPEQVDPMPEQVDPMPEQVEVGEAEAEVHEPSAPSSQPTYSVPRKAPSPASGEELEREFES